MYILLRWLSIYTYTFLRIREYAYIPFYYFDKYILLFGTHVRCARLHTFFNLFMIIYMVCCLLVVRMNIYCFESMSGYILFFKKMSISAYCF